MEYRTMKITGGLILAPIKDGSGDLEVPYGITELTHTGTFTNCTYTSIRIPSSVKEIRSDFFEGLTTIKTIYYDSTLEDWLKIKFKGILKNSYTLYIDGEIAENIEIPTSITSIPNHCFYFCSSLRSVKFHDKVTQIGECAFNKSGLSGVVKLYEGIEKIDKYAFLDSKISRINIPASLTSIDNYAFAHCTELEYIDVDDNNSKYRSIDGVLFNKNGNAVEFFPPAHMDVHFGKEVNYICQCAFSGKMRGQKVYFKTVEPSGFIYDRFFKCSNIKFMVPQGKKSIFLSYGDITEDCVECYFDVELAIIPGTSIEESYIYNNPYRTLGAFSNSSPKEIAKNCNDILNNDTTGNSIITSVDNLIAESTYNCHRDTDAIAKAQIALSSPQEKIKQAFFWFAKEHDGATSYSTLINKALGYYLKKEYDKAIELTSHIIENEDLRNSFTTDVCGSDTIFSRKELYDIYIKELFNVLKPTALVTVFESLSQESKFITLETIYLEVKKKVDSLINITEKYASYSLAELKDFGDKLKTVALELEETVTMLFGADDEIAIDNADRLCRAMIDCALEITKKAELINRPDFFYAFQLAWKSIEFNNISQECKEYRQKHFSKISDILQLCPPNESAIPTYQEYYKIKDSVNSSESLTIQQMQVYLESAGGILMQIKTMLPDNDLRLNHLSSMIVDPISEKAIIFVRKFGNIDSNVYLECAHLFMLLNEFKRNMNEEREKRFKQYYNEIIDLCVRHELPYFMYTVPFSFVATQQELSDWQNSSSFSGAEYYKEKYKRPHFKEVIKRVEYLKKSRSKRAWIIIPIVIAIILLIVGLATA